MSLDEQVFAPKVDKEIIESCENILYFKKGRFIGSIMNLKRKYQLCGKINPFRKKVTIVL